MSLSVNARFHSAKPANLSFGKTSTVADQMRRLKERLDQGAKIEFHLSGRLYEVEKTQDEKYVFYSPESESPTKISFTLEDERPEVGRKRRDGDAVDRAIVNMFLNAETEFLHDALKALETQRKI